MKIFPAIDLKGGRVVRLTQGDYGRVTQYAVEPEEAARSFVEAGAKYVHIVDLDGAKDGTTANLATVARVLRDGRLFAEVGGGIRDRVFHALHVFEVHALHHAAIADVQAGNDSLGDHAPSSASFSTSARFSAPEYSALPTMAAGTPISRRARTSSRVETPPEATISSPFMPSSVR